MQGSSEMSESSQSDAAAVLDNLAERSLGIMCQKFIMLFLISSKVRWTNLLYLTHTLLNPKCIASPKCTVWLYYLLIV